MSRSADADTTSFEQHVRARLQAVGPVISISGAPECDPFGHVAARLWGSRDPADARAVVVYAQNPQEAEAAAAELRSATSEAGRPLPAVAISPTGSVQLPGVGGRTLMLPCPTTIGRLARAIAEVTADDPAPAAAAA
jgi:hypothetical protein